MPAERYFYNELFPELITLQDQEFHHLARVMRAQPGESIELINGQGQLATATITTIDKKQALLHVEQVHTFPNPDSQLILAQAIPRLNRLELILEKATELGATEIWLFPGQRSEKIDFSKNQLERLQHILIAAIKQCGRYFLPKLVFKPPMKKWHELSSPAFFGDIRPEAPLLRSLCPQDATPQQAFFCVGPESGFTEEEVQLLEKLGAKGAKLHPNILRTETATLAALSLLSHWMMR